jgi:aspartyl-tRNA(Asn)/glutamyl-tRNA(Gln) amidotransferase subunit A
MGSSTEMSAFKTTRNPWDATRVPGGSSGGSAVAVAARLAPLALGSDTGGSIRQPAAFCGVMGLKPTYGRVSRYGLVAFASSLDQIGPLARTTADLALTLALLSGADEHDATSAAQPVPDYLRLLREQPLPRRIGVPWRELEQGVDAEVLASFREALRALESSGVTLVPIALPHLAHAVATYYIVATAEASSNLERYDGVRYGLRAGTPADLAELYGCTRDAGFGPEVKRRIILGTFVLSTGYYDAYYLRAQKARALIRQDFEQALATCDAIAMPTTPTPPFRIGEKTDDPLKMYLEDIFTVPANLAGLPGLSLPIRPARQLPCGLQLLGRAWDEIALLRLGGALEEQGLCTCSAPTL